MTLLAALPWPGNMAELRALTERLAVIITRGVLLLEDVLANVRLEGAEALGGPSGTLREARERFERDYVAAVLQHHRGRMGTRALGIERTNSTERSNNSTFAGPLDADFEPASGSGSRRSSRHRARTNPPESLAVIPFALDVAYLIRIRAESTPS